MSNESARPIDISNIMSTRALAILRTFSAAFAALDDFRQKGSVAEASTIVSAIVKHVRSSDPMAAIGAPSVEMPVIENAVIAPAVEAATEIERDLADGHGYRLALITSVLSAPVVVMTLRDPSESATSAFELEQAEALRVDLGRVLASVKR